MWTLTTVEKRFLIHQFQLCLVMLIIYICFTFYAYNMYQKYLWSWYSKKQTLYCIPSSYVMLLVALLCKLLSYCIQLRTKMRVKIAFLDGNTSFQHDDDEFFFFSDGKHVERTIAVMWLQIIILAARQREWDVINSAIPNVRQSTIKIDAREEKTTRTSNTRRSESLHKCRRKIY